MSDIADLNPLGFSVYSTRYIRLDPPLLQKPQDLTKHILWRLGTIRKRALFECEDNRQLVGRLSDDKFQNWGGEVLHTSVHYYLHEYEIGLSNRSSLAGSQTLTALTIKRAFPEASTYPSK
jgi:hypothetical protein